MKRIVGLLILSLLGTAALAHDGHGQHGDGDRGHYSDDQGRGDDNGDRGHGDDNGDRGHGDDNEDRDDHKRVAAPEIDPAGAFAAFALLAGGLAVLRGRRSAK